MGELGFKKFQPPSGEPVFDYKNPEYLQQFLTQGGKIIPARVCRLSAKQQRRMVRAVKRARQIALLPNGSY